MQPSEFKKIYAESIAEQEKFWASLDRPRNLAKSVTVE